jgi:hypothetical protein
MTYMNPNVSTFGSIQSTPSSLESTKLKNKILQKSLLVLTVACAALALIPPLRLASSLALRGIGLLSSVLNSKCHWEKSDLMSRVIGCFKIVLVSLGIVALATASPILLVASLVGDIGAQSIEMIKCLQNGECSKALMHFGVIVIDTLALTSIAIGSWQLMTTAAGVSVAVMIALGFGTWINAKEDSDTIDIVCYACLSIISIIAIGMTNYELKPREIQAKAANYDEKRFFDSEGNTVASWSKKICTIKFYKDGSEVLVPEHAQWETQVASTTYAKEFLSTVPVGSTAIVTKQLK